MAITIPARTDRLEQAISVTRQTDPQRVERLMRTLAHEAMSGTVQFQKNLTATLRDAIAKIDAEISEQLAAVMHAEKFKTLEGSWRGLHHLIKNTENLTIRLLNVAGKELSEDSANLRESQFYEDVHRAQFGTAGGHLFAPWIVDLHFAEHPDTIYLLCDVSSIAATGFSMFVSAPDESGSYSQQAHVPLAAGSARDADVRAEIGVIDPAGKSGMTSRMVVMMTPDDKRAIESRARAQGMTPSEFIRRAARDYTPMDASQESALGVLADELEGVVAGIRHDLGSALDDLAAHRAEMAALRASVRV